MTPKQISDADQAIKATCDLLPPALWGMYSGLVAQGFNESQALVLTVQWMAITFQHQGRPPE